jgi:protein-tyrosine phosphatase
MHLCTPPTALPFISQGIEREEPVLVHCDAGISRSGSVVVAYLMASRELSFEDALKTARAVRVCIDPNEGFTRELKNIHRERLQGYLLDHPSDN